MSNSEIDISKLSLEQLQGLLKQTETVSRRACRGVPRRPPAGSALGDTEGSEARAYASCLPRAPQETKNLALSLNSLKVAQARFTESANSLAALPADFQKPRLPAAGRFIGTTDDGGSKIDLRVDLVGELPVISGDVFDVIEPDLTIQGLAIMYQNAHIG